MSQFELLHLLEGSSLDAYWHLIRDNYKHLSRIDLENTEHIFAF